MHDTGCQISNAQHVLIGLRGQAQHEVQLHGVVAPGKGRAAGLKQILLGDIFIDDIPQPLGTGLRGEGQAALAALGQPLHQVHGEVVRPQTGQGQIHMALLTEILQLVAQLGQGRVERLDSVTS